MATTELASPLIGGQAGVANEWGGAAIEGEAFARFTAQADHGVRFDVGLGALVGLDASFSKFVSASAQGEAHAELSATVQIQVPMNLFEEVGAAVRLRISAEAAAGVTLSLGLNVGDFISLVESQVGANSLESRLFLIFLEEVTIGGGVYAKAAASAMAYATLVVAGRAIRGSNPGEDPGFSIIAEAGAGLKAGAGFRVFFKAGIDNFPRFVGRSTDLLVDDRLDAMARLMPPNAPQTRVLAALQAPAKIAFRLAFEMGYLIASERIPTDAIGGRKIALRACQVILEESQRYLLDRLVGAAVDEIRNQIETRLAALNANAQRGATPKIEAFGRQLLAAPAELFHPKNADYWVATIGAGADALAAVTPGNAQALKPAALLWSAIELIATAMKRLAEPQARASFNLAGLRTGQAAAAFSGPVTTNPPSTLRPTLEQLIGLSTGDPILQQDLVTLLVDEGLALAQRAFPEVDDFIRIFQSPLGGTIASTAQTLLGSFGGVVAASGGGIDEDATLAAFVTGLQYFVDAKIENDLAPILRAQIAGDPVLSTELDEVLLPALHLMVDTALPQLTRWSSGSVNQSTLKEIFSSVLMTLAGRTLVVTADVLTATAEERMSEMLNGAADALQSSHLADKLESALRGAGITIDLHDVEELVEEALRVGAEVFAPLPGDTRARIRSLLYDVLQTLPASEGASFQQQLEAAGFIPNETKIRALATELATIAAARLQKFAELILLKIAEKLLAELMEVIAAIERQVVAWLGELGALIDRLQQEIAQLIHDIAVLVAQAAQALEAARGKLVTLLASLGNTNARTAFLDGLEDAVYDLAHPLLTDNVIYKSLPRDVKRDARAVIRGVIRTLAHNGIVETILDAIGDLTTEADDFFADVRTLDPHEGLATGILDLLLGRIETRVRAATGGDAGFSIGFDIGWSVDYYTFDVFKGKWIKHTSRFSERIELARVHWDLDGLLPLLRRAVETLAPVEQKIDDLATALLAWIGFDTQAAQKRAERDGKQTDRAAAVRTQDESSSSPTRIDVLEPVQSAIYERPVTIRVRLPDTPASFVGAADAEQQRVFLWLNAEEIPRAEFAVDALLEGLGTRILDPGESIGKWSPPSAALSGWSMPRGAAPASTAFASTPASRSPSLRVGIQAGMRTLEIRRNVPKIGKPIGVKPAPTPITGVSIIVTLPIDRFEDGVNTLVVAVVNGHGQRVTQSVTFIVSAPLTPKTSLRQPRLGDVLGFGDDARPAAVARKALVTPHAVRRDRMRKLSGELERRTIRFSGRAEPQ